MRVTRVLTLLGLLAQLGRAVFVDEAFQTDYHYALVGIPREHATFFHQPHPSSNTSLLYTLTEKSVVGAINPKNGSIIWRHHLDAGANPSLGFLRAGEKQNSLISAVDAEVTAWDPWSGRAVWSNKFADGTIRDLEVLEFEDRLSAKRPKDAIVLLESDGRGIVRRLDGNTGDIVWEFSDGSGDIPFQISTSASNIYMITLHGGPRSGYKIRVLDLDPLTGKQQDRTILSSDSDISDAGSIHFVGANVASPIIAWTDKNKKHLKVNILGSKHVHSFSIPNAQAGDVVKVSIHAPYLVVSRPHFLVHYQSSSAHWAEVYHVDLVASAISKAYDMPRVAGRGAFSVNNQDGNVYFVRITESEALLFSSSSHGILARWQVSLPRNTISKEDKQDGVPSHAICEVVANRDSSHAVRCALTLTSGDWILLRNGETAWQRPEALAGVVAAEWANLGNDESLAEELRIDGHDNILVAYIHRWRRHVRDLAILPVRFGGWIRDLIGFRKDRDASEASTGLYRDSYGFHRMVIVATENGRVYGLDTGAHGKIAWVAQGRDLAAGEVWDVKAIFVDDGQRKFSVRGGKGDVYVGEIQTGKAVNGSKPGATPLVQETAIWESGSTKYMLDVYEDGGVTELPLSYASLSDQTVVTRGKSGSIEGFRFQRTEDLQKPVLAWEFIPPAGERIVSVAARPMHDPVASIGRVLGDRSVMYKHLDKNMVLATTVNDLADTASFYLLDAVTGGVVHSMTHGGVDTSKSISTAMSENWFVYTFWGQGHLLNETVRPYRGYQLGVAELYESPLPNDRAGGSPEGGNHSSLHPSSNSTRPHVVSAVFFIPEEMTRLAVTQTRQGITSRSILGVLRSSDAIIAIPKSLADPRRPVGRDPSASEGEEGLIRRTALLEFNPQWIINHRREALGIGKIITSPANLESTSLVFAYGIDLFGTRLAPSLAFDMLGKEFAKGQLVLTVVALGFGVLVLAPMVRKKQINMRS
ncbi:MAG: hypothetical protein M1815_003862 [Lichina confinis]|nr:MAG: hypothetical protein M1815_003862 [Lichina confinis]